MTAMAAGLALIPLALGGGRSGSEIQTPMAIVILCGLMTSTLFNMVVVPTLYLRYGRVDVAAGLTMRIIHWLFLVSVALFITGIGFIIASARGGHPGRHRPSRARRSTPVATVKQIMAGISMPAAYVVFDSVGHDRRRRGHRGEAAEDRRRMGRGRRQRGGAHRVGQPPAHGRSRGRPG